MQLIPNNVDTFSTTHLILLPVHDGYELVGSWLRSNPQARVVGLQEILDKCGLTSGVLSQQHDSRWSIEVTENTNTVETLE